MARANGHELRDQILEVLLDKIRQDPYPSTTMLDMVETLLRGQDLQEYTNLLIDKVSNDAFPSIDHLRRLQKLA
jgi:hypothetical protein